MKHKLINIENKDRYSVDIWIGYPTSFYMIWDNHERNIVERTNGMYDLNNIFGEKLYEKCRELNLMYKDDLLYLKEIKTKCLKKESFVQQYIIQKIKTWLITH